MKAVPQVLGQAVISRSGSSLSTIIDELIPHSTTGQNTNSTTAEIRAQGYFPFNEDGASIPGLAAAHIRRAYAHPLQYLCSVSNP